MSEDLLVTLGVQDKGAKQQITALNKEIRYLDKEFKTVTTSSKKYETGTASLQKQQEILNQKMTAVQNKLNSYNKQMSEAKEGIARKKEALETLNNTEGDNEKAIERVTNELNKYEQQLRDAERNINLTENQLQELSSELLEVQGNLQTKHLQDYANKLQEMSERMETTAQRFRNFGDGLNTVGNKLIALGSPIMALSGYAAKVSIDFESAMSEVQATSGATGEDLELLTEKAKEMGAKTSKSATDSANALQYMALAGWDTQQMLTGLEPILRMSELANADLGRTSDLVTDSMSALGVEVGDLNGYLDIVAKTQSKANTSALDMLEAYIGVGGMFKEFGTPLEESATLLGILANRGIKSAEAGTSLNSVLINLMGVGGQAAEALAALGVSAYDSDGNFRGVTVTLRDLKAKLAECTEEQRQQFMAMVGGKTQIDTLAALLSGLDEEYGSLYDSVSNAEGSLLSMAETMQDNTKGNITRLKSQLEGLGIQLGEHLLPHLNDLIGHLSKVIEWFGNLDDETQNGIIKFGFMSVASGTLLKGLGSLSSGIGNTISLFSRATSGTANLITKFAEAKKGTISFSDVLGNTKLGKFTKGIKNTTIATTGLTGGIGKTMLSVSNFGKSLLALNPVTLGVTAGVSALALGVASVKTHNDLMSKSVATAKEDLSGFEKVVSYFTMTNFKSREELEAQGLVLAELSEGLSTEFKDAVNKATEESNNFRNSLNEWNINGFTEEEYSALNTSVETLCNGAITTIRNKQTETQTAWQEMFDSDGLVSENELKVLELLQQGTQNTVEEIDYRKSEILRITQEGLADRGELNAEELLQIQEHQNAIRQLELESLAMSQEEQLFAKNDFMARVKTMTHEQAIGLLEDKKTEMEEQKIAIESGYNTQIDVMKLKLAEASEEDKAYWEAAIAEQEIAKTTKISEQEALYQEMIGIALRENGNLLNTINRFNGEEITQQDIKNQTQLKSMTGLYEGLDQVSSTGLYRLKNNTTKAYEDIAVTVDNKTGEMLGVYSRTSGQMGGYSEDIAKSTKDMGINFGNTTDNVKKALEDMGRVSVTKSGDIRDENNKVVGSLKDVKKGTDDVSEAIVTINGKEMKIKTNAVDTTGDVEDLKKELDNLPNKKDIVIRIKQQSVGGGVPSGGIIPGRSISMPQESSYSIPDIPKQREFATYDTMNLNSDNYTSESTMLKGLTKDLGQQQTYSDNSNIDYVKLGEAVALAVSQAISNLKIEPIIQNMIDGQELTSTVSMGLTASVRGRR